MKKSDLKTGMILVSKKGSISMFTALPNGDLLITIGSDVGGRFTAEDLDEDFNSASNDQFSIERIHQISSIELAGMPIKNIGDVLNDSNKIWEREKPLKLVEFDADAFNNVSPSVAQSYAGFDDYTFFRGQQQFVRIEFIEPLKEGQDASYLKRDIMDQIEGFVNGVMKGDEGTLSFDTKISSEQFAFGLGMILFDGNDDIPIKFLTNSTRVHDYYESAE